MLPWLDPKKTVTVISARKNKPSVEIAAEKVVPESSISPDLKMCAEDILGAIQRKSVVDLAKALKAAFEICDMEPHIEGPHMGEE